MNISAKRLKQTTAKWLPLLILLVLAVTAVYNYIVDNYVQTFVLPEGTAEFHFIDVGQGDSILIVSHDGNMLIDTGDRDAEKDLESYLNKLNIKVLEYAVFTHPHEDHIGGAGMIFESFEVKNVILPNVVTTTRAYQNLLYGIESCGSNVIEAVSGNAYSIGELHFQILSPNSEQYRDLNNYSVVLRMTYGDTAFMMTGDAEALAEAEILAQYEHPSLTCDVLKVGHHGSGTSSSAGFLSAVSPAVSIISCGRGNSYGHPHSEVVKRLETIGSTVLRTDRSGTIVLRTDGSEIRLISSD